MKTVGRFRTALELMTPTDVPDGAGGVARSHAPTASVWALVEPLKALPGQAMDQEGATITHRITIRFRTDVDSAVRFRHGDRVFRVTAVHDPDGRRRHLVCLCKEPKA